MKRNLILVAVTVLMCLSLTACKGSDYKKAIELQEAQDFLTAASIYETLGDYQDASIRLAECKNMISYNEAVAYQDNKDFTAAAKMFEELGSFLDSESRLSICNEMNEAIKLFGDALTSLEEKNNRLDDMISAANDVVFSEDPAIDETLRPALETAISETKAAKVSAPNLPETADEIIATSNSLLALDYSEVVSKLNEKQNSLESSIKQYALVDAPDEAYVITCLKRVPGVIDITAATEDNDPNGNLNKAGGYTAAVFFSHGNVNQSEVYGTTLIEKGTDAGGQIEVYSTLEDAIKRNTYLAAFDGTIFASGSHYVLGTVVVRTSNMLTASQQKELEANIIAELIRLD